DAGVGEIDGLRVHRAALHVVEATGGRASTGRVDHAGGEVGGDETARRADALGDEEAGLARTGRQLEVRTTRTGVEVVDDPVGHRPLVLEQARPVRLPRGRDRIG